MTLALSQARIARALCGALLALAIATTALAHVTHLTPEYQKLLRARHRFHALLQAANLPPPVLALCADERGKLADPHGRWQSGSTLASTPLPMKRLIWAVTDGTHYVVHYERGTPTHSYHVMIATADFTGAHAKLIWRARGASALPGLTGLLKALDEDTLDDAPARYF